MIKNKRILITGAAGSIGSELCRQLSKKYSVIALDIDESRLFDLHQELPGIVPIIADIRERVLMMDILMKHRPEMVFNCAALKHVPLCEKFSDEAYKTNIDGLCNVITASMYCDVKKFVQISSDKAVNPDSIMGRTKKLGEELCEDMKGLSNTKFTIVRFGNVLNSRGSLLPIFRRQIEKNEPLTVTDKRMERYFMSIPEACDLILKATELGEGKYIFDMGEPMNILELAKTMVKISGKNISIKIIGRRPGEKFKEELYDKKSEKLLKTKYKNILKICQK